jgi:hypothetical protein
MIILALLTEVTARLLKVTPSIIGDVKNNWPTNGFVFRMRRRPSTRAGSSLLGVRSGMSECEPERHNYLRVGPSSMKVCTSRRLPLVKNSRVVLNLRVRL